VWEGTSWGYQGHGFVIEEYIPVDTAMAAVPEFRFAFLYGQLVHACFYADQSRIHLVYNAHTHTYHPMFNVSANEFAKMSVTAHAISRHFGFHWGRVDLLIDSTTGRWYVNEVQDMTDDMLKTFLEPRADNLVRVPPGCRSALLRSEPVRRVISQKHGTYWGSRYPFVNRADVGWAKAPSYEAYMRGDRRLRVVLNEFVRRLCRPNPLPLNGKNPQPAKRKLLTPLASKHA